MRKIKCWIKTDAVGSEVETTFVVDDNCTDEEIDEWAFENVCNRIEWSWEEIEENE